MRQDPLLHAGEEHDFEFQSLGGVKGHQGDAFLRLVAIEIGHERQRVEVIGDRSTRILLDEFACGVQQLIDVLQTRLILNVARLLQHAPIARAQQHVIEELRKRIRRRALQIVNDVAELFDSLRRASRQEVEPPFDDAP